MTSEASTTRAILAYLKTRPGKAIKLAGGMIEVGTPDILYVEAGRAWLFEVKTKTGKPTTIQDHRLAEWRAAGAVAIVVRSVDDVRRVFMT